MPIAGLTIRPAALCAPILAALALLTGVAVFDDYGKTGDATWSERPRAEATLRYLGGDAQALETSAPATDSHYGPAFEVLLVLAERLFGLEDERSIFLCRHLLTHLFFLAAGLSVYWLAFRLFGNRGLALFALALFLLHPRIYAHSFFNSKDVPFLSLFMICLWLAQRAFAGAGSGGAADNGSAAGRRQRRDNGGDKIGAFALLGVAAGVLTSLRIMGAVFIVIVVAARACDCWFAATWRQRRRVIVSGVLFAVASVAAYFAAMPYLWNDPLWRFAEGLALLSQIPYQPRIVFLGEVVSSANLPMHYLPVWFGITTPLFALGLGMVGVVAFVLRGVVRPCDLLRNTSLRFELMLVTVIVLSVLAMVILRPTLYTGWRHNYFLWAPFVLLAASGLRPLADAAQRLRLPWGIDGRSVVFGLAALGLGVVAFQMARLHPHQQFYFNELVNQAAPEQLRKRFQMYGYGSLLAGDAYIREERERRERARRGEEKASASTGPDADPSFYVVHSNEPTLFPADAPDVFLPPVLYAVKVYGSTVLRVATPDLSRVDASVADAYRRTYRKATASEPVLAGDFNVYRSDTEISLVRENCRGRDLGKAKRPRLTVYPLDPTGFSYWQAIHGVRVGKACLWQAQLPDYAVAQVHLHGIGRLDSPAYLAELRRRYAALYTTPPAASAFFDTHLSDGTLTYLKAPCHPADTKSPFFLHVTPRNPGDLSITRRRHGFDNLDFRWDEVLASTFDGVCMATRELPDYPIANVATGQFSAGEAAHWRIEVDPTKAPERSD